MPRFLLHSWLSLHWILAWGAKFRQRRAAMNSTRSAGVRGGQLWTHARNHATIIFSEIIAVGKYFREREGTCHWLYAAYGGRKLNVCVTMQNEDSNKRRSVLKPIYCYLQSSKDFSNPQPHMSEHLSANACCLLFKPATGWRQFHTGQFYGSFIGDVPGNLCGNLCRNFTANFTGYFVLVVRKGDEKWSFREWSKNVERIRERSNE